MLMNGKENDIRVERGGEEETPADPNGEYSVVTDRNIKQLVAGLKRDGLIKGKSNTLVVKNKALFINGTKQAESVNRKYFDLIKDKDFNITIK